MKLFDFSNRRITMVGCLLDLRFGYCRLCAFASQRGVTRFALVNKSENLSHDLPLDKAKLCIHVRKMRMNGIPFDAVRSRWNPRTSKLNDSMPAFAC